MALIALVWSPLGSEDNGAHLTPLPCHCSSTSFHQRPLQAGWKVRARFFFMGHEASTAGGNKGPERNAQDVTDGFDKSTRTHSSNHMWAFSKQSSWESPHILGNSYPGPSLELAAQASASPGQRQRSLLRGVTLNLGDSQEPPECSVVRKRCLLGSGSRTSLSTQPWSEHSPGARCQAGWQWVWPKVEQGIQDTHRLVGRKNPTPEQPRGASCRAGVPCIGGSRTWPRLEALS